MNPTPQTSLIGDEDEVSKAKCRLAQQISRIPTRDVSQHDRDIQKLIDAIDANTPSSSLSLADRLDAEIKRLDDMPPSIQSQANIRLINAVHEAVAILRGNPTPATRA